MLFTKVNATYQPVSEEDIISEATRIYAAAFKRGKPINSVDAAGDYFRHRLAKYEHEVFAGLFLNNAHRILKFKELFRGTINASSVYPREVAKEALACNAAAVIFGHNHPSGSIEPSTADIEITHKLQEALSLIDVNVLDHFVVGDGVTSFSQRGLL